MEKMPSVFVSHGMPTIVETPVPTREFLQRLGSRLPRPTAVLCISAHFESWLPLVTAVPNPETIHGRRQDDPPPDYVVSFDAWLEEVLCNGEAEALLDYEHRAPEARRNHPYPAEHFLPLFVSAGAAGRKARAGRLHAAFLYGVLSMAAYAWD